MHSRHRLNSSLKCATNPDNAVCSLISDFNSTSVLCSRVSILRHPVSLFEKMVFELFSNSLFWTAVALIFALCLSRSLSRLPAPRRNVDPGLFGIKLWPARIAFLLNGYNIVNRAYQQVSFQDFDGLE